MTSPWKPFFTFWNYLREVGKTTQAFLNETAWAVNPVFFYTWCIKVIGYLREVGMPTFEQPAWFQAQELLEGRIKQLEGTSTNLYLTQTMSDWRDYDWQKKPPPNRFTRYTGPYSVVVSGYDKISPILNSLAGRLFGSEENEDVDILGRTITLYEAIDCVWYMTRRMCENPMFQMRDPYVPKWFIPFPWLEFVEKDLRGLRDKLAKDETGLTQIDPDEVPWSMPND